MILDEISEMVAKRLNMSPIQVREINRIQWKMLHKEMQSGDFKSVQIFYIGKFSRKLSKRENTEILTKYINESGRGDI